MFGVLKREKAIHLRASRLHFPAGVPAKSVRLGSPVKGQIRDAFVGGEGNIYMCVCVNIYFCLLGILCKFFLKIIYFSLYKKHFQELERKIGCI